MAEVAIKWTAAALAATLGLLLVLAAVTNRWPTVVVVRNEVEDATCAIAFSDGFTWNIDLRRGEEKFWLFVFGSPDSADASCSTPTRTFHDSESFTCGGHRPAAFEATFSITEPDPRLDEFCVMASLTAGAQA